MELKSREAIGDPILSYDDEKFRNIQKKFVPLTMAMCIIIWGALSVP